ncbi:MAG: hypothetical protein GWM98_04505 [Nitrospinaceae bacterium]|nr:hypothetical protein [Nitrospinaceae bacterium]NIR53903.1 hypothetical protein [Nitrospinaceae bacterium]NIS84317.1 hypothetical protein [Nitrospinaceae bacterium]NIT81124.1 hypothetical protein [Nitrospinaceae bacterium]NIU43406.1 hypothetical protein [Nitrospinaceae bacterium]
MGRIKNQAFIDKCIVSFSHNRYESRSSADRFALEKARREIAQKKKGVSHLILRAEGEAIDRLKFLFLVGGIPIMCFSLGNLLLSSLKEIVVVGSSEVKLILDHFLEVVDTRGKKVRFVHEDPDNLMLINTMILGRNQLSLAANELVLFQPGDLPFMYDLEGVLRDPDLMYHNLILWLNSRQAMFPDFQEKPESEFVARNYHYRAIDDQPPHLHDLKEPNVYPINLSAVEEDIIELLHQTRKDGKILNAGISKVLRSPTRMLRLLPVLANHFRRFDSDLKKFRLNDQFKFGMHLDNFNRGTSILLDTPFLAKFNHDPAFVADVDALEDWEDYESLIHVANGHHGGEGLGTIHPFGMELLRFKNKCMPQLKKLVPMYADFPGYLNDIYRSLEMQYVPYDSEGRYDTPNLHTPLVENACRWYAEKTLQFIRKTA